LDALIITGANVIEADLSKEIFWDPLMDLYQWAYENVTSTLCSCLASHAVLLCAYGIKREHLEIKRWGVFEHDLTTRDHPLIHDVNTRIVVPHSRFNDISAEQMEAEGLHVLATGPEAGVQLAVSPDGFRSVFFQGHPEYDRISLMKEYKRDVGLYAHGELDSYPPVPKHYFNSFAKAILEEYRGRVEAAKRQGSPFPEFPESHILQGLHNTWHDSGEAIVGNWIGLVYQLTNAERSLPFMDGIDINNPLNWDRVIKTS